MRTNVDLLIVQGPYRIPEQVNLPLWRWSDAFVILFDRRILEADVRQMTEAVVDVWQANARGEHFVQS